MDIHRCRFVPYPPSAINAIAVSHPSTRTLLHVNVARMAIGRANGDIEIWNPLAGAWYQETVLSSGRNRSVEGLAWIVAPDRHLADGTVVVGRLRLFSIGYTSTVTEWDLEKGRPKAHVTGIHGDIWCMAAQPVYRPTSATNVAVSSDVAYISPKLAIGTVNGELALYSTEDDELRFSRVIVRSTSNKVKSRIVSLAFQSASVIIVGCSDSTIRAYDLRGTMLRRMTLGIDLVGDTCDIIAWSVKCLPDGNIVSGDSTGCVCLWDGRTYTQIQKLQNHKQDVLSLATSADGSAIISGGMDRRTVLSRRGSGPGQRWIRVWGRRYHDHDVKAMASVELGRMSVVVTGGWFLLSTIVYSLNDMLNIFPGPDASPVIIPLRQAGRENHRTLSSLPQRPPMTSAPGARFLVSWWDREVYIWRLSHSFSHLVNSPDTLEPLDQNRKLLKTIVIKDEFSITSATISHDGSLLILSTLSDVKAFYLRHYHPARPSDIKISQIALPQNLSSPGATKVELSPDGRWLCLVQNNSNLIVASFSANDSKVKLEFAPTFQRTQKLKRISRDIPKHVRVGGLGEYNRTIVHAAFSHDSKLLATADLAGYVDTFVLQSGLPEADNYMLLNGTTSNMDTDLDKRDAPHTLLVNGDNATPSIHADGNRWIRNPVAKLLPKLPAAPVVLSFSNDPTSPGNSKETAMTHPILLAITTSWHVLAFNPLQGALSTWSRRNPRAHLPADIAHTRDLAKGALWQGPRVWIYGASFVCMLDLSQDLPRPAPSGNVDTGLANSTSQGQRRAKRKRRPGRDDGAGSLMEIGNLIPNQIRRLEVGLAEAAHESGPEKQANGWEDVDMDATQSGDEAGTLEDADMADGQDDEEDLENPGRALVQYRRREGEALPDAGGKSGEGSRRPWWLTYKYRPILGIVPIGIQHPVATSGSCLAPLEVAIVERPAWNLDLPDKYFGKDEWERSN